MYLALGDKVEPVKAYNAWLSPDGGLYFAGTDSCQHDRAAEVISNGDDPFGDALINSGWVKLSQGFARTTGYVMSWYSISEAITNGDAIDKHLTQAQQDTLWDIFSACKKDSGQLINRLAANDLAIILGVK